MAKAMKILIVASLIGCLVSVAYAAKGTATFYTAPYVPSACYGYKNEGVMIAAASDALWKNRGACGKKYRVRCIGGTNEGPHPCTGRSVVVKIVDYCPSGCQGTIDLSQQAFKIIANPDAGKVKIQFKEVKRN